MKHSLFAKKTMAVCLPIASTLVGCTDDNNVTPQPSPVEDGKYNIIFITTDQEAFLETYPAGSDYEARNRLRELGTSFEKHYACSNVSTSSRSVIYTGRHITETQMLDNTNYPFQPDMDTNIKTVGDMLREANYYTAYKGKWHLSEKYSSLEDYGFSDWTEGNMFGSIHEGYDEDGTIADNAISWLKEKGKSLNQNGQQFFLAVNFLNPHDVMYFNDGSNTGTFLKTASPPDDPIYKKSYSEPLHPSWNEPIDKEGRPTAHYEYNMNWGKMVGKFPRTEDKWISLRDYYYNCIQDNDRHLYKLISCLEDEGLLENSIVIFTSDHGEMMGAHGMKGKGGNIYEYNIHVPLIIYHPEYEGGRKCTNITSHIDLAPTLVELATGDNEQMKSIAAGLKGHSLVPAIENPETDIRNNEGALFVYDMISMMDGECDVDFETFKYYHVDMTKRGFLRGIITPEYKFARYFSPINFNTPNDIETLYGNNDVELYLMGTDEMENLAFPKGNNEALVKSYNDKLNNLISREIGVDDGRETDAYVGGLMNYAK